MVGREVRALRQADVLCDIGGITFCDGREIFLLYNVLSVLPAMLLDVPVVKLSQAMGPFRNPLNRFLASRVLPRCRQVFARGKKTAEHLNEMGLEPERWREAADVAFAWQPEFSLTRENPDRVERLEQAVAQSMPAHGKLCAIVPSSLVMKKSDDYIPALGELAIDLVAAGVRVLLLPNATREGIDKGRNNDLFAIRRLIDWITSHSPDSLGEIFSVDFDLNTGGIRRLLAKADVVVTSRFHGMVASLAGGIPAVVIGWSHKYREVMEQFGCGELGFDHRQAGTDLTRVVLDVIGRHPVWQRPVLDGVSAARRSAESQFDYLADLLRGDRAKVDAKDAATASLPARESNVPPVVVETSLDTLMSGSSGLK
jgi:polysaccharide pyruvyl transferase WcaK-like protein